MYARHDMLGENPARHGPRQKTRLSALRLGVSFCCLAWVLTLGQWLAAPPAHGDEDVPASAAVRADLRANGPAPRPSAPPIATSPHPSESPPAPTFLPTDQNAGARRPKVFILHSYGKSYIWCLRITQGISDSLHDLDPEFRVAFLDAKNKPDPTFQRQQARAVLKDLRAFAPDVVIASDDPAQIYLVEPYLKGTDVPVIFCGVNADPARYGYPAPNVSGVKERYHCREGFKLLKRVAPNTRTVAFVADDSESAHYVVDDLNAEQAEGPFAVRVSSVKNVRTYQSYQAEILRALREDDAIALGLYQSLVDDKTGQVVPPSQVVEWMRGVITKPTLGFSDPDIVAGTLCGVLESGHEQGHLAGGMARTVLVTGTPAGSLPVTRNEHGLVMLNLNTAERLGLSIPFEIIEAAGVVVR